MDLHQQFKEVVDGHLQQKLAEIGVGEETFYEACASSRFDDAINKQVYNQLTAMDDFLTFKRLMVRRNMELEMEAVKAIQASAAPVAAPSDEAEEEKQMEAALRASADMSPQSKAKLMLAEKELHNAEEKDSRDGLASSKDRAMEDQLKAAMDANLTEMELFHKQEEYERLQLEQAIAESLAMHEGVLQVRRANDTVGSTKLY